MCMLANTSDGPAHRNKSLICVPLKTNGVTTNKIEKLGNHSSDTAQIFFENVVVPKKNIIGKSNLFSSSLVPPVFISFTQPGDKASSSETYKHRSIIFSVDEVVGVQLETLGKYPEGGDLGGQYQLVRLCDSWPHHGFIAALHGCLLNSVGARPPVFLSFAQHGDKASSSVTCKCNVFNSRGRSTTIR